MILWNTESLCQKEERFGAIQYIQTERHGNIVSKRTGGYKTEKVKPTKELKEYIENKYGIKC